MTKRDQKHLMIGTIAGIGLFLSAWLFRKKYSVPVLNPTVVQWEGIE